MTEGALHAVDAPAARVRPVTIPASRYTSPDFARREMDRLWPRVWQLACTVDHVAAVGDFYEYRLGPYSVLIVRGDDGELRAFQNACRHRGSALCAGSGSALTEIRCPFHRWTWDLRGQLREVPSRREFGVLNDDILNVTSRPPVRLTERVPVPVRVPVRKCPAWTAIQAALSSSTDTAARRG